jgi:pimeloyl-ACP methyl ester carboxylesterase
MSRTFHTEEVIWKIDDIPVYGTLTRPDGEGPYPCIIFVAGSGPTDRDWCSPLLPGENGSGRLLADVLTREGFVTLRYDKRIAGAHGRENFPRMMGKISMQGHTDEIAGAVNLLVSHEQVDPGHLYGLTSSEGAIHALHYQLQTEGEKFHGLVLTGAPGRSIAEVARSQISAQVADLPDPTAAMEHFDAAIKEILAGNIVKIDPLLPESANILLQSLAAPVNQPFSLELWSTNPAVLLSKIIVPVLIVIGKKDVQVDWQIDGQALEKAVQGHNNVTFAYPDNADHVLKYDPLPKDSSNAPEKTAQYNARDRILDPEAERTIVEWLQNQSSG